MICEICEEEHAVRTCSICGRHVCNNHIRDNICSACLETLCEVCMRRLATTHCSSCGRLICRLDSYRVALGRLCIECSGKHSVHPNP